MSTGHTVSSRLSDVAASLVVRAADGDHATSRDLGWTPHADGTLEIVETSGTHHSLRRRPSAEALGARLLDAFDHAAPRARP